MTTLTTIAGVAIASLIMGILAGVLLWRKYTGAQTIEPRKTACGPIPLLWDIHSLLNAMNRFAVAAERRGAIDPALIYNLSDYLLHSSLLQREGGWSDAQGIENWLIAHLRILAELRAQSTLPTISMKFAHGVRRIEATQLIRQLLWFLQRAQTIDLIEIHVESNLIDHTARVTINVFGTMEELDSASIEDIDTTWHLEKGKCACEMRAAYEPLTAVNAGVSSALT